MILIGRTMSGLTHFLRRTNMGNEEVIRIMRKRAKEFIEIDNPEGIMDFILALTRLDAETRRKILLKDEQ